MILARFRQLSIMLAAGLLIGLGVTTPTATAAPAAEPAGPSDPAVTESVGTLSLPYCNARSTFSWRGHAIDLPVAPGNNSNCIMARGAFSWGVYSLQEALYWCHDQNTGGLDRDYGPRTEQAVRNVQGGLGITRDGVYGPQTRNAMRSSSSSSHRGWWAIPGYCTGR